MKKILLTVIAFTATISAFIIVGQTMLARAIEVDGTTYQRSSTVYDKTIYRAAERLTIYDLVNGDVYCLGNDIIIDAVINGDILCAGNSVRINGTVEQDIRAVGEDVIITGDIGGNVSIVAESVTFTKESSIANDATVIAKDVILSGQIGRDVTLRAESILISGAIGRNVNSYHSSMVIASDANIGGSLSYSAPETVTLSSGAVVGSVTKTATQAPTFLSSVATGTVFLATLLYVAWFVSLILTALGVAFLFPKSLEDSATYVKKQPWVTTLAGIITLFIAPTLILLLTVSVIGIPLAIILGLLFAAVVMLGTPFVAHLLGTLLFPYRSHPIRSLVGAVLLLILFVIPVINIITIIATTILGTGMVIRVATERYATATLSYKAGKRTKPV